MTAAERDTNHSSLSTSHVPGTALATLHISSHWTLSTSLARGQYHVPETLKVRLRSPVPWQQVGEPRRTSRSSGSPPAHASAPPQEDQTKDSPQEPGSGLGPVCAKDRTRAWSPGAVSVVNAISRLRRPRVTDPAGGRRLGPGSRALRGEGKRGPGCSGQDRKWQPATSRLGQTKALRVAKRSGSFPQGKH